jgi:hypothetical protein
MGDMGDVGMAFFHFFSCPAVLVHLVLLVVIFIFFSLFLQFVLLQRIVDIYICILRDELIVPSDGGATTWRFGLSEAHIGWFEAHHKLSSEFRVQNSRFKITHSAKAKRVHVNTLPLINTGAILFTTKVVANLLLVVRETTG